MDVDGSRTLVVWLVERDRQIKPPAPRPPATSVEELRAMLAGMNNENDWARP